MIKWPSIGEFRNVVKNVQHHARYKGQDDFGNPIFDPVAKLPTLAFEGTVKLHGTNASVACNIAEIGRDTIWCQSRENIITPEKDNAGFAMFVESQKENFVDLLITANGVKHTPGEAFESIVVFGEWCGSGIQKGVAISELPKMFVIFGIAKVDAEGNKVYFTREEVRDTVDGCREYVLRANGKPEAMGIYCIWDFPVFHIAIDFENPHLSQNTLNTITEVVEECCPVGKTFDVEGIGEGVVWRCADDGYGDSGYWFKVKGEKHSNSKVKTLATVDVERINNIRELAERLAHEGRLEQGCQAVFNTLNGGEVDTAGIGPFIKWVMQDIFKEELDTIAASGFTGKDLNGPISKIARDFIMKKMEM